MASLIWLALFAAVHGIYLKCNLNKCSPMARGNGVCSLDCMNSFCNFDSYLLENNKVDFTTDCELYFIYADCELGDRGNGVCDEQCNAAYLGYDLADCSFCGPSCKYNLGNKAQLGGTCDEECNVPECYYDMGACRECSVGCNMTIWGNGVCDEVCNNVECNFDMEDCVNSTCATGCNTWMVGNSICDKACYVEECEYDKADCTCAPFCTDDLLKNGICDEVCNNLNCKFDNGDCGYCNSECSEKMLANNVCDPECNTKECEWDYYACGCADGCAVKDYGSCKPECLVGTCNYDRMSSDTKKWCNDRDLVLFTVYQQMLVNDTSYVVSYEKCLSASNYKCSLTMALDMSQCHSECLIPECNYGLCNINSYSSCKANIPSSGWNLCRICASSTETLGVASCNQCFDTSIYCTNLNLFGVFLNYSNYLPTFDLFPHLSFYYVTSKQKNSSPSGDGSINYPFETIKYAFSSIKTYHNIFLLMNDGSYDLESMDLGNNFEYRAWKIAPQDDSKITLYAKSWNYPLIQIYGAFEMENLIIEGDNKEGSTCKDSIYCSYCSYNTYNKNDGFYYNDRGERVLSNLPNDLCNSLYSKYWQKYNRPLFLSRSVRPNVYEGWIPSIFVFRNVKFINHRTGYSSIIGGEANLRLYNVDFDNIWLKWYDTAAVISLTGEDYSNADLIYIGGSVTRLNNGYEYDDQMEFRGFLYSPTITSVLIRDVEFKYNLVYRKKDSIYAQASLIYISAINFLKIDNCTFMYNYCENGIINLDLSVKFYPGGLNETYYISYLYEDHLYINSSRFISNYGKSSLIDIDFFNYLINIHFENLTFEGNGIEQGPAITISNSYILDEYKDGTVRPYKMSSGRTLDAILGPRWCKMDNLSFKNNHGVGLISLSKMVHVSLKNIAIDSNGSPNEDKNLNSLLLTCFIRNQDIYLKREAVNHKALDCDYMVSISNSYNVDVSPAAIIKNTCRNSSPTYSVVSSDTADIASVNCSSNVGNGALPICFLLTGNFIRVLKNSSFEENVNSYATGAGAIEIKDSLGLYINNCTFRENTGDYGGAINAASQMISIESSLFKSNYSPNGYGGALLYLQTLTSGISLFEISSTDIRNNSALYGGSIFIAQQWTGSSKTDVSIKSSNFYFNTASYASCLYFDSTVTLADSSAIWYSNFIENSSKISACVIFYSKGNLNFSFCDFLTNSGRLSSALQIDISDSTVTFDSCKFSNNKGLSVILIDNQNSISYINTMNCIFEYNYGSAISLNYDSLHDSGSIFRHNLAASGSCLRLQNSAIAISDSSKFLNNTSSTNGGAVLLSSASEFYCSSCRFASNKAQTGGAIYAEQDSVFSIFSSDFNKNSCDEDGSAIYGFNTNRESYLNFSKFYENNSKNGGSIVFINSKTLIESSRIYSNQGGIKLSLSNLSVLNSHFSNQSCTLGCFIYTSINSDVYIKNSIFSYGISNDSGGAIYSSSSSVEIENSEFKDLSSLNSGGVIYSSLDVSLTIKNSKISDSHSLEGGIIYAYQTPLTIENFTLNNFSKSGIYGSYLEKLEISRSSMSNGNGRLSGGVYCYSCGNIKIKSCSFNNNEASLAGGAIYFDSQTSHSSTYEISSCSFTENSANKGGALYINDLSGSILTTTFTSNKAISNQDFYESEITEGIGGAIKLSCIKSEECKFSIKSCNFTGNSATYNGGAINWDDWKPKLNDNYFMNNVAEYGNDYSSYPIKLMSVNENGELEGYKNRRRLEDIPISNFSLLSVAPGQDSKKPIMVALVDNMNQIITTDNASLGELKSQNVSTIIAGITKVKAHKGIFTFSQYRISDEPGLNVTIGVFTSAIDNNKKIKSGNPVFDQNLLINIELRVCEIGEIKAGKNCEVCGYGYYSLATIATQCLGCPSYAQCFGSYQMAPKPGYWRDNAYTDKFWKCPNHHACLGSPDPKNVSYTGLCNFGYKGNKCQSCKAGFSRTSANKCEECPSFAKNLAIIIAIAIALFILVSIMVRATIKSAFKPKTLTSIYIRILLNYLQMVILTSTFKLNWPSEILKLFYIQSSTDYIYQQLYSFQCLLEDENSYSKVFYKSLIMISLIPILMAILAIIIWIIIKLKQRSLKNFWDDYISTCIILLFLVHPSIIKKMFASFNCTEINSGEYWLEEDLDIRCWDDEHKFYVLVVSLPSILFWGILLPTICLVALIRKRGHLEELNVRLRYGFLFNGYHLKQYYWEFIIIYSKIILICCSVFLTNIAPKIQALIAAILLTVFLHIQYSNSPYVEANLNHLELQAKFVCVITVYSGLFYLTGSLGDNASLFFFFIILIANCYFLAYWTFCIFRVLFCFIYQKTKIWRSRYRISNDPDIEKIRSQIIISHHGSNENFEASLSNEQSYLSNNESQKNEISIDYDESLNKR
ncbi:unnamed protein product [Blepharisma stoltei]|uniref:LNR domain-containing protein n=1 Tax=Blepharisma stoltei TaxID=1481888 RepID=A0AAU9JQU2_9CILI|nr:unnamed protein product [Blepharisma stoltei]